MSTQERIVTILIVAAGTILTRFLPFIIFRKKPPQFIVYLGKFLPAAVFGMLIVYCLKDVTVFAGSRGIPEGVAITLVVLLHLWKRNMLLSVAGGTVCYMLLVQLVF